MTIEQTSPNPGRVFSAIWTYQQTRAFAAIISLNLLSAIGEGIATAEEVANRIAPSEKGTRILCDLLTIHGFLLKEDEAYALHPETAPFLDNNSPTYPGGAVQFLLSPTIMGSFDNLTEVVRRGGALMAGEGTAETDDRGSVVW
jgi:hypothetical protein